LGCGLSRNASVDVEVPLAEDSRRRPRPAGHSRSRDAVGRLLLGRRLVLPAAPGGELLLRLRISGEFVVGVCDEVGDVIALPRTLDSAQRAPFGRGRAFQIDDETPR